MRYLLRGLVTCLSLFLTLGVIVMLLLSIYMHFNLPDVQQLNNVQLQVPMRIYTADHKLMAEFGEKRRIPIQYNDLPKPLIQAILATEDQRFFEHEGIDPLGLMRAAFSVALSGTKSQGGSTITMQVARNYFLSRKKTYGRKLNEILLAIKIDQNFSKEKILELYFNKIFFGNRAYGVAAAAYVYYGKTLNELTLPQIAMLAGLPKAPSTMNPLANKAAAMNRRNHVLGRMLDAGYIDQTTYDNAIKAPITASFHGSNIEISAPYVAEMVRQYLLEQYGENAYIQGFQVTTTIDSHLQRIANHVSQKAILDYDKRHGYRGPVAHLDKISAEAWQANLDKLQSPANLSLALVTEVSTKSATILLADGSNTTLFFDGMAWAKRVLGENLFAKRPSEVSDVLKVGDIIYVEKIGATWQLSQNPNVEGALVALNPNDGSLLALVGGFDNDPTQFNRATQAQRQPGSNIKPFLYAAALEHGLTLATLINDAPIVVDDPSSTQLWRPQNDSRNFHGPTRLRVGLIKSRNLVSIRILDSIGINFARNYLQRFGFKPTQLPEALSLALGSGTASPLELANAYAVIANGGHRVKTFFINQITDANNKIRYQAQPDQVVSLSELAENNIVPAPQVISDKIAFLITSAMQDVIKKGTGRRARILNRQDLAGKTGTTNDQNDAWFSGFNRDLVLVSWMGFDNPKSLHEYGAQAALPMWIDFMRDALKDKPEHSLAQPPGIISLRIDAQTGLPAINHSNSKTVFEYFREDLAPQAGVVNNGVDPLNGKNNDEDNAKNNNPVGSAPSDEAEKHLF